MRFGPYLTFATVMLFFSPLLFAGEYSDTTEVVLPYPSAPSGYAILKMPKSNYSTKVGLFQNELLENQRLRVVEGRSDQTLASEDLDGATAVYHLEYAWRFFQELVEATRTAPLPDHPKTIVRVRMDRDYNAMLHYASVVCNNDSFYVARNKGEWDQEIWFNKRATKLWMKKKDWLSLFSSVALSSALGQWLTIPINVAGTILKKIDRGMDSAKMSSAIYHEAFHWAADSDSRFKASSRVSPINESYANYFGSSMLGRPELAEIDAFTSRFYRRNYSEIRTPNKRKASYNHDPFVPSLFWHIRKKWGQAQTDQLVWKSIHRNLTSHKGIPASLLKVAQADSSLSVEQVAWLESLLKKYEPYFEVLDQKFIPKSKKKK